MNKKIKVIQILDNYADGKEIFMPKYVKYFDRIYKTDYIMLVCQENIIDKLDKNAIKLNDEVEILEDNTEEIDIQSIREFQNDLIEEAIDDGNIKCLAKKCNELVKAVKKLDKDINYIDN